MTACSSDDDFEQPENPTESQVYTLVIQASKGSDTTTRALSLDGTTLNAYWSGTETIEVGQNGVKIGTATAAANADGTTTITATLTSAPDPSSDLNFYLGGSDFDYTTQSGLLSGANNGISEKYDYNTALLYSGNFTVSGNNVSPAGSNPTLNFENPEQAVVKFTLVDKDDGTTPINAKKLNIHDSKATEGLVQNLDKLTGTWTRGDVTISPLTTNVIYAALVGVYQSNLTLTASDGNHVFSYSKSGVDFNSGKYYEITVKMNKILSRVSSSVGASILSGGYTAISDEQAAALAKQCWTVAGNTVYVVYSASGSVYSPNVSYAYTSDGKTTSIGSATTMQELLNLYGGGANTAWFVEPAAAPKASSATTEDVGKVIGADGKIYANATAATEASTTAVAMITYVGSATGETSFTHGLALAMSDASS